MPNIERTGERRLDYSDWHRERCPRELFTTDLDFVEYRHGREAVGLMEIKYGTRNMEWTQQHTLVDLADRSTPTPLFQVNYRYIQGSANDPPRTVGRQKTVVDWDNWETWEFKVTPKTSSARLAAKNTPVDQWINESAYIRFLTQL